MHHRRILLIVFAAVILLQRIRLYDAPLHGDICAYAVLGHEMMHGRQLYSDLWERKPPLLYITYAAAETITGYNRNEIFLLGITAALVSLVLIYQIGSSAGPIAGLLAAAFWMLMNADLDLAANQTDPEVFINVCLMAAFLLLVRRPWQKRFLSAILLGALFSAATLYKHNTAIVCVALAMGHLLVPRWRKWMDRFMDVAIAGTVMIAVWALMLAYFAATGRLHAIIDVLFHQNASYSGSMVKNLAKSTEFSRLFPDFMIWAIAPAGILAVAILFSFRDRSTRWKPSSHWLLLLAWAIGTWPTIALTGYVYGHYYQLWLPIGCVAGGWAGAVLLQMPRRVPPVIAYPTLILAMLFLIFRQGSEFLLTPQQWVQRQFPYFNLVAQNQLGVDLGKLLKPDQQFWELGEDNALYFFSKHSPPTGLLFIDPFLYGDETQIYWTRLLGDLNQSKPALVILSDNWTPFFQPDAPVFAWLKKNYVPWNTPLGWPHYQMFVRRGIDLDQQPTPATAFSSVPPVTGEPSPQGHR